MDGVTITSTIGNTTTASTSGGTGGTGTTTGQKGSQNLALGFVLASNKVAGSASASIDYDSSFTPPQPARTFKQAVAYR